MTDQNETSSFGGSQLGGERVGDQQAGAGHFGGDYVTAPQLSTEDMSDSRPGNSVAAPQLSAEDMTGGRPGNQTGGDWENRPPTAEEIAPHLAGLQYPIGKADLVQSMRWQKAPLPVIYRLEKLPERNFADEAEIRQAVEQLT